MQTLRCASLEGGFSLWEEYRQEARNHIRNLQGRAIEVKYEDFLAEPHKGLSSLARFCGLVVSDAVIANLAGKVKRSRAYAYKSNAELKAFVNQVTRRLRAQGY